MIEELQDYMWPSPTYEIRDIPGLEDRYMASTIGEIISKPNCRGPGKIRKLTNNGLGYQCFSIYQNGKPKNISVHRAVALTFIPTVADKNHVNHKDSNRSNNRVENLEWVTPAENHRHGLIYGNVDRYRTRGERHGMAKLTQIQVVNIRHCRGAITSQGMATLYGVSAPLVRSIWRGELWQHIGETSNNEGGT